MTEFIDNGVWDNNGACIKCGFMPFNITSECYVCNPCENNCDEESCNEKDYEIEYAEEEPVTWEINREKSIIIDEDKSSYDEMFNSLEKLNERGDTESIHILEDQIYRRFIKDVALKKFTNVHSIIDIANTIHNVIIKPNEGTWDTCRWYA